MPALLRSTLWKIAAHRTGRCSPSRKVWYRALRVRSPRAVDLGHQGVMIGNTMAVCPANIWVRSMILMSLREPNGGNRMSRAVMDSLQSDEGR